MLQKLNFVPFMILCFVVVLSFVVDTNIGHVSVSSKFLDDIFAEKFTYPKNWITFIV